MSQGLIAFYMHDLAGGGVERMRLLLIDELSRRGLEVCLILGKCHGALVPLLPPDVEVIVLDRQGMLPAVRPLMRVLHSRRPRFLVSSLDHNNITAILACRLARTKTRVIICQHNALSAEMAAGWRYRVVPWLYWLLQRGADGIVAVSRGVAKDLAAAAGISPQRITVIYNPVIGPGFAARAAKPSPHLWLLDKGPPVCVFAGRLVAQKDPALALRAISFLPFVRLIVLGEGPLLGDLQDLARKLGIADRVDFVGFQANPLPWIANASCVISSSRHEGLGNVLIEAFALGTPVVATDCPYGPAEILLGGALGALVPVGDAVAFANAVQQTLAGVPDRPALRARGAQFSAATCATAHLNLFQQIRNKQPKRRAFGIEFSPSTAVQIVELVLQAPPNGGARLVVTPNIDHVRLLRRPNFRDAYRAADIVCPDGFPVLAYARCRGLTLSSRVTGCEIFERLVQHSSFAAKSVLVVAESADTARVITAWAETLKLSRLKVIAAPIGLAEKPTGQADLAQAISAIAPDILVMTLGAPVSELFIHQQRAQLPSCWALCLGQAVRAHLGLIARAPAGWQKLGLEWLWRIHQEPRRLAGRYLKAAVWFPLAVLADLRPGRDHPSA